MIEQATCHLPRVSQRRDDTERARFAHSAADGAALARRAPGPSGMPRAVGAVEEEQFMTLKNAEIHELLLQSLETERGGIAVYETALECALNARGVHE